MSEYVGEGTTYELQWLSPITCAWQVVESYHTDSPEYDKHDAQADLKKYSTARGFTNSKYHQYRIMEVTRRVVS